MLTKTVRSRTHAIRSNVKLIDEYTIVRYIALVALVKILPTHPHLVSIHHDTILACVDDADMSIRLRALDLVEGMVRSIMYVSAGSTCTHSFGVI